MRDGDYVYETNGQTLMVEAFDKANQDVAHALLHPYDPDQDYGNETFREEIPVVERLAVPGIVERDIGAAISRLRRTQRQIGRQYMPDSERITRIKRILSALGENSSVQYLVVVEVADASGVNIEKAFQISNRHLFPTRSKRN